MTWLHVPTQQHATKRRKQQAPSPLMYYAMTARDQNPAQQASSTRAMPASVSFLLGEFPSGKMRRRQQSWHMQATWTTLVQV